MLREYLFQSKYYIEICPKLKLQHLSGTKRNDLKEGTESISMLRFVKRFRANSWLNKKTLLSVYIIYVHAYVQGVFLRCMFKLVSTGC